MKTRRDKHAILAAIRVKCRKCFIRNLGPQECQRLRPNKYEFTTEDHQTNKHINYCKRDQKN